jgi:outer membrane protein insertion porin family
MTSLSARRRSRWNPRRLRAAAAALAGLAAAPSFAQEGPRNPTPADPAPPVTQPGTPPAPRPAAPPATPGGGATVQPTQPEALPPAPPALERYEGRPIREVRVIGLKSVEPQLVDNQIRSKPGLPLSVEAVQLDIQRLNRLGRFRKIDVKAQAFDDGSIALVYEFAEVPIIKGVEAVGNRQLTTKEIGAVVSLLEGTPVDRYQLDRARRQIQELYRKKGYYLSEVTVDEEELDKTGIVLFRIVEGERIKIAEIRFEEFAGGKLAFTQGQLYQTIKSRESNWFETGPLDDQTLDQDMASLVSYYQDRGYLDVRVGRRVQTAPNGREAIVSFVISEGQIYTMRSVRVEQNNGRGEPAGKPPTVFTPEQIAGLMVIKAGDVYSADKIKKSVKAVEEAYGRLGRIDSRVQRAELRDPMHPVVDLLILVSESPAYKVGLPIIRGDTLTKQTVIRRDLDFRPDRPLDTTAVERSRQRLEDTRLFEPGSVKITFQPEDPSRPGYRDVLIEVDETNTGSLGFGVGVNSDLGVQGEISIRQRNFDVLDVPDSFGEFIAGRAFRGGGQSFDLTLAPGNEVQTYSISLTDPRLFDSDYSGSASAFYLTHQYDKYDEHRLGTTLSVGRRFGERWTAAATFRAAQVKLKSIDADAPVDVFDSAGPDLLTGVGVRFSRFTSDSRFRPSNGTKFDAGIEQVGALGGDFNFTKLNAAYSVYLPIYESFLGYKTVWSFNTRVSYIPQNEDEVPVYERYYQGGRDFRGFSYRTVSPKGIRNDTMTLGDDPVGGTWSFFFGTEVEQPIWQDVLSTVFFVDTGTVTNQPGFDDYRVSVGLGLRIYVNSLSPLPLAFDFGFPILKQEGDKERIFSFSLDLPFK